MEERTNRGINDIDTNNLVEVTSYKKADKKILDKVLAGLGVVLVGMLVYCNANGINLFNFNKEKAEEPEETPTVAVAQVPTTNPSRGTTTPTTQTPTQTTTPTTSDEGKGGPVESEADRLAREEAARKAAEEAARKAAEEEAARKAAEEEAARKAAEEATKKQEEAMKAVEDSWVTETLPEKETITFGYYDAAEERESKLSNADKAYIQEYMDYYGISYEDARVSYLQWGPLTVPTAETPTETYTDEVEYETKYVFDEDDLATINALVSELGMSKSEAEAYYINTIAPSLGKPIATEIVMIKK